MQDRETIEYNAVAKFLHWSIAALVIINYLIGSNLQMNDLYGFHKQTGLLILSLMIIRIIWKIVFKHPAPDDKLPKFERVISTAMQHTLYLLLFLVPLTGIFMVQYYGKTISLFGLVNLPNFVPTDFDNAHTMLQYHSALANAILILALLHALAAIKHTLLGNKSILFRIIPNFIKKFIK